MTESSLLRSGLKWAQSHALKRVDSFSLFKVLTRYFTIYDDKFYYVTNSSLLTQSYRR